MLTKSFWIGGFECACHRRRDGRRLDLIEATGHDRWLAADYERLRRLGMTTAREGVRWHLIEPSPGRYDFSSLLPMVRTARDLGIQVIWDLCHYGWPDDLDVFGARFADRFAAYAREVARVVREETGEPPLWAPVNEISFLSWAGGDVEYLNPFCRGRGFELKVQLVRATLAAIDAVWEVDPRARIVHADPAIHIAADPRRPEEAAAAEEQRLCQFQGWEMLRGGIWPQLGGAAPYLDVLGVNYYPGNQWVLNGGKIQRGEPLYRPFRAIVQEIWERFGRPMLITETGAEGEDRAPWLRYVSEEVRAARRAGVPVHGICLYPILDYPGWDDDRHCPAGLWGFCGDEGEREEHGSLAMELELQTELFRREEGTAEVQLATTEEEIEHAVF
ncbi:MAG TPA: beta-glucosidase [Thermoanaerobaculia bacterium]|nr:beta-glucosidase [Thermoanaerobaculia bacterium]